MKQGLESTRIEPQELSLNKGDPSRPLRGRWPRSGRKGILISKLGLVWAGIRDRKRLNHQISGHFEDFFTGIRLPDHAIAFFPTFNPHRDLTFHFAVRKRIWTRFCVFHRSSLTFGTRHLCLDRWVLRVWTMRSRRGSPVPTAITPCPTAFLHTHRCFNLLICSIAASILIVFAMGFENLARILTLSLPIKA